MPAADKPGRSKLLSWMKRLTKNKSASKKHNNGTSPSKPPHELSYYARKEPVQAVAVATGEDDAYAAPTSQTNHSFQSLPTNEDTSHGHEGGGRSLAPTVATNPGTLNSDVDRTSKAGTSNTMTGGGGNSIFSTSDHSSHSLATTLTTIQSAPLNGQTQATNGPAVHHGAPHSSTTFAPGYPVTPASAVPPHLNPHVPTTYRSATANNLLSDNASVLTLASSSHRPQRRNSLDTNASIRAIAPSSVWGGSRESLPISVLSQSAEASAASGGTPPPSAGMAPPAARSASGIGSDRVPSVGAPVLSSERNSIYISKTAGTDGSSVKGGSVRSGMFGHSRNDSTAGSIGGYSSQLAIPKEAEAVDGEKPS